MSVDVMCAAIVRGQWQAGIGDPTFLGWFTAAAYLGAAALCAVASRVSALNREPAERWFWFGLTCAMVLLGINKQLDLQTWLTLTAKHFAQQTGWYAERRVVQALFIFLMALGGMCFLFLLWAVVRRRIAEYRLALTGIIFQVCFVIIRAASFHHIDQFLRVNLGFVRVNHVLELGGIFLIGLAAWRTWRAQRKSLGPAGRYQFVLLKSSPF